MAHAGHRVAALAGRKAVSNAGTTAASFAPLQP